MKDEARLQRTENSLDLILTSFKELERVAGDSCALKSKGLQKPPHAPPDIKKLRRPGEGLITHKKEEKSKMIFFLHRTPRRRRRRKRSE